VEGLDGVLAAAQLSRCGAAAAAWCDEQGAANLEALELKPLERRRLEKVDIAVTEPEAPGGPTKIQLEGCCEGCQGRAREPHEILLW